MDHLELNKDKKTIIKYLLKKQLEFIGEFEEIQIKMATYLKEIKHDPNFKDTKFNGVIYDIDSFLEKFEINNNKVYQFHNMIQEELNQEK